MQQDYIRRGVQSPELKQNILKPTNFPHFEIGKRSNMDGLFYPALNGDLGSSILDLHAIDSELLLEAAAPSLFKSRSPFAPVTEQGFENSPYAISSAGKQLSSRLWGLTEHNSARSTSTEKDRSSKENGLARIKVVVRKRSINNKELAQQEDDIITIAEYGCSLTVHEPKVKAMKLLGEVDKPGSRIGHYASELNQVLSRKVAGLLNLQARLARFQRLLREQEVLRHSQGL